MQIGNRALLDGTRDAMRDAFDAVWMASSVIGDREARALRCATKLDKHADPYLCTFIGRGWRLTSMGVVPHSPDSVMRFSTDIASSLHR
jgi:hypothetical protein